MAECRIKQNMCLALRVNQVKGLVLRQRDRGGRAEPGTTAT